MPAMALSKVDLPAPLGPTMAVQRPLGICKLTWRNTSRSPNCTVKAFVSRTTDRYRPAYGREVLEVNSGVMLERLATESSAWWHRAEAVYESALLLALDP